MRIDFQHCQANWSVDSDDQRRRPGFLTCPACSAVIDAVDVSFLAGWIETQVEQKRRRAAAGELRTRKQAAARTDDAIDRDGLYAEAAACVILCPDRVAAWQQRAERQEPNRGCDLLAEWVALDRPVEVKHTRYADAERGFLFERPPRNTAGGMTTRLLEDAYYVLLTGQPPCLRLLGWIDRSRLAAEGTLNPVPLSGRQRETWGIHWSRLSPAAALAEQVDPAHRRWVRWKAAVRRWRSWWTEP